MMDVEFVGGKATLGASQGFLVRRFSLSSSQDVRIIHYKGVCVWLCSDPGQVWDGWEKRRSISGKQLSEGPRRQGGGHL